MKARKSYLYNLWTIYGLYSKGAMWMRLRIAIFLSYAFLFISISIPPVQITTNESVATFV